MQNRFGSNLILGLLFLCTLSQCQRVPYKMIKRAGDITVEKAVLKTHYGFKVEGEAGWLGVPENRTKANKKVVRIPFFRLKSRSANPGPPIIYLSGGPGDAGIEEGKGSLYWLFDALRDHADVILFDQRGTGAALPSLTMNGRLNLPLDQSLDSKASQQALEKTVVQMAEFLRINNIDPSAYNTLENATDVKDLLEALSYKKANIIGYSYGTHLALALMKYHPEVVNQAVLIGANGLDQRWRSPRNLEAQIEQVQQMISADSALLKIYPNFTETVVEVLKSLEANPKQLTLTINGQREKVVISKYDLEVLHVLMMGSTQNMANMALTYYGAQNGNYNAIAEVLVEILKRRPIGNIMTYLTSSASGISPQRKRQIEKDLSVSPFGDAMNYPFNQLDFQALLHSTPLRDEFRADFRSDIPTLIISGDSDVRTSVQDAKSIKKQLINSHHYIIPNTGHNVLYYLPESINGIKNFFQDGIAPKTLDRGWPMELKLPHTQALVEQGLAFIEKEGIEKGIAQLQLWHKNKEQKTNSFLVNDIAYQLLENDQYKKAYAVYEIGIAMFPKAWYLQANAAISLSRIGSEGVQIGKGGKEITQNKKKAYELYLQARKLNPYYYSNELAQLK